METYEIRLWSFQGHTKPDNHMLFNLWNAHIPICIAFAWGAVITTQTPVKDYVAGSLPPPPPPMMCVVHLRPQSSISRFPCSKHILCFIFVYLFFVLVFVSYICLFECEFVYICICILNVCILQRACSLPCSELQFARYQSLRPVQPNSSATKHNETKTNFKDMKVLPRNTPKFTTSATKQPASLPTVQQKKIKLKQII